MTTVAETFALAWQHHEANDLTRAEQLYRQVLQADASHADAWCFLGAACQAQGRIREADEGFRRAIHLRPNHVAALNSLGILLAQQGKLDEAAACFQQLLVCDPANAEAINNMGLVRATQGRLDEAIAWYERALQIKAEFPAARANLTLVRQWRKTPADSARGGQPGGGQAVDPWAAEAARAANLRGIDLANQGRLDDAQATFEQALQHDPNDIDARNNLGGVFDLQDRIDEAIAQYQQVLILKPDFADAHYNLAIVLQKQGRFPEAVAAYRHALECMPNHLDAQNNLGITLMELSRLDEAADCFRQALTLNPNYEKAWNNLGSVFEKQGRLDEAGDAYRQALKQKPDFAQALNNMGNIHRQQSRFDEAMTQFDLAVRQDPNFAEVHFNRALLWLLLGDWEKGLPEYEWRLRTRDFLPGKFSQPRWDGRPLAGRTLLVLAEQGLGDTVQFIRYVLLLQNRGDKVVVQCPAPLRRLLVECGGVKNVVVHGAALPHFDVYVPLLSLPGILKSSPTNVPADVPYLHAVPALVEKWRRQLALLPGIKIGFAWQGKTSFRGDCFRSIPLEKFTALAELKGAQLISLQKGTGLNQWAGFAAGISEAAHCRVIELGSALDEGPDAFMDTAAVMMNLDLVISSDTVIPHLAGALGIPAWVALSSVPDWRWLLERDDTPWYPTLRLFRQRALGDWDEVFTRIVQQAASLR